MNKLLAFSGRLGSGKDYMAMQRIGELKDDGNTIYIVSFADPIKQILRGAFAFQKSGKVPEILKPTFTEAYVKNQVVGSIYSLIKFIGREDIQIVDVAANYDKYADEFYQYVVNANEGKDYKYAFRRLGQLLGTELGRHIVDTIWIDLAFAKINYVFDSNIANYAFIADCRFVNEYVAIRRFGEDTKHESEVYGVVASDETRAQRRGMTMEELKAQDEHGSEKEIDDIILRLDDKFIIRNER